MESTKEQIIEYLKNKISIKIKTRSKEKNMLEIKVELLMDDTIISETENSVFIK